MSPKKVRLVANTIKGLDANQALTRLRFIHRSPSPVIAKLLKSAIANALHNNNLSADTLMVKKVVVNEAAALKRWKPAAFGSAHPFKRRGSHIDLVLGLKAGQKAPKVMADQKKKEPKEAVAAQTEKPTEAREEKRAMPERETGRVSPKTALLARKKPRKNPSDN